MQPKQLFCWQNLVQQEPPGKNTHQLPKTNDKVNSSGIQALFFHQAKVKTESWKYTCISNK